MNEPASHRSLSEINYHSHANTVQEVMAEVLQPGMDESYCFLNERAVRENLTIFREHFLPDDPERKVIYAMKANPHQRIMNILAEEGIDGFDCASGNEIKDALSIKGAQPDQIYFNNPIKRRTDIGMALSQGVRYFTEQSRSGVSRILSLAEGVNPANLEVAIRLETLNPEARINLSEKYGCSAKEGGRLVRRVKNAGIRAGLAINTGSQNSDAGSFVKGIKLIADVARRTQGVSSVNVGGGIPVNYFPPDHYETKEYLKAITRAIQESRSAIFGRQTDGHQIIVEPGRSLVASAVDLAIPILEVDRRRGANRIFINDGIFTSFSDSAIHGWRYAFDVFPKDGRAISGSKSPVVVYGRTCDSGDVLGEYSLPDNLEEGDFIWVRNAGAYMDSQSSRFNGFETPKYVSYNR